MSTQRPRSARPSLLIASALLLAGCGQRGDLFLPTPQKAAVPPAAGQASACAQQGSEPAQDSGTRADCGRTGN